MSDPSPAETNGTRRNSSGSYFAEFLDMEDHLTARRWVR